MDNDPTTSANKKIIASFVAILIIVVLVVAVSVANKKSVASAAVQATANQPVATLSPSPAGTTSSSTSTTSVGSTYKDGTYTASSSYQTPGGQEDITVKLSLANGAVTGTTISQAANNRESEQYQGSFKQNYSSYVVGKKLSDINLSRVSGSSLTSDGFNQALDQIMSQAKA